MSESDTQRELVDWLDSYCAMRWPEWCVNGHFIAHSTPNEGKRSPRTGARMKAQGLRAGVPDLHIPIARGGYHGLWIELKDGRNKPTESQKNYIDALNKLHHRAIVCYGFEEAKQAIEEYMQWR